MELNGSIFLNALDPEQALEILSLLATLPLGFHPQLRRPLQGGGYGGARAPKSPCTRSGRQTGHAPLQSGVTVM